MLISTTSASHKVPDPLGMHRPQKNVSTCFDFSLASSSVEPHISMCAY